MKPFGKIINKYHFKMHDKINVYVSSTMSNVKLLRFLSMIGGGSGRSKRVADGLP